MNDFYEETHYKQIPFEIVTSEKHHFEGLSNRIIGAAIR